MPLIKSWLGATRDAAQSAGHIWPEYAACEAALESNWGESLLARNANNLFGMKQHQHPTYGTVSLPTREYLDNQWQVVATLWVSYPSFSACFADRMATLRRLAPMYPHYALALGAATGEVYVCEVSASWSTDPLRAVNVMKIFNSHKDVLIGG